MTNATTRPAFTNAGFHIDGPADKSVLDDHPGEPGMPAAAKLATMIIASLAPWGAIILTIRLVAAAAG